MEIKKKKIRRFGNSFGFLIPKSLVKCGVLEQGKEYNIIIRGVDDETDYI